MIGLAESRIIKPLAASSNLLDGIVSCWELDETSGTVAFDSTGLHDGTIGTGVTVNQSSVANLDKSMYTNKASSILISNKTDYAFVQNTHAFSISCWMKLINTTARSVMVSNAAQSTHKGFIFMFETYSADFGLKAIRIATYAGVSPYYGICCRTDHNAITDTNWHHVVVSVEDTYTVRFYIDGQYKTATFQAYWTQHQYGSGDSTNNLEIFGHSLISSIRFGGNLDQVAIWNRPITADEALALYNSGNGLAYNNW